jgi:hypothetical protein
MLVAVIDKILAAIDVANGNEQILTCMSIGYRGLGEDNFAGVETVLILETGTGVDKLLMAGVQHRCCQTANNLTTIQVSRGTTTF